MNLRKMHRVYFSCGFVHPLTYQPYGEKGVGRENIRSQLKEVCSGICVPDFMVGAKIGIFPLGCMWLIRKRAYLR